MANALRAAEIFWVDLCPTKYFTPLAGVGRTAVESVRGAWASRGLKICALQSLFFGLDSLNLFDGLDVQQKMIEHLGQVASIGRWLGARILVFGSPKQRRPGSLSRKVAYARAVAFFTQAARRVEAEGLVLALEACTATVGCTFVTTHAEALRLVKAVGHPGLRVHLDTATLIAAGEQPEEVVADLAPYLAHVHASEPGYGPLGAHMGVHRRVASALARAAPRVTVALEMLPRRGARECAQLPGAVASFASAYAAKK